LGPYVAFEYVDGKPGIDVFEIGVCEYPNLHTFELGNRIGGRKERRERGKRDTYTLVHSLICSKKFCG
jgi:hypothetical protein